MTFDHDHPDTDLTDPHGEAEALRRENARLQAAFSEVTDPDFIWGALDNVHDCDTTLDDYAAAVSRAQRAALAASRAPDPVVNDGSCQPCDLISRAELKRRHAIESHDDQMADAQAQCVPCKLCGGPAVISDAGVGYGYNISCSNGADGPRWRQRCLQSGTRISGWAYNASDLWNRLNALPAAPVADAQPVAHYGVDGIRYDTEAAKRGELIPLGEVEVQHWGVQPTIGGAELDALAERLLVMSDDIGIPLLHEAADAITTLRAQPDWKAMAERLGDVLRKHREVTLKAMRVLMSQGRDGLFIADDLHKSDDAARAALSDLAKMKGE